MNTFGVSFGGGNREWGNRESEGPERAQSRLLSIPYSLLPIPGSTHAARVADTGGTLDARRAGTNTAAWPITSIASTPTSTYGTGSRVIS